MTEIYEGGCHCGRVRFRVRADFPLRLEDFAAIEVSWGSKAEAIARALRVANAFGSEASEIDVRIPQRTLVREPEGPKVTMGPEARRVTGGI